MSDCPGCNKPMIDGQALNGLLRCHWDCQEAVRKSMGEENTFDLIKVRTDNRLRMDGLYPGHHLYDKLMDATLDEYFK